MAIRIIQRGDIKCDECGKELGKIKMSRQVMEIMEAESRFTEIQCGKCAVKKQSECKNLRCGRKIPKGQEYCANSHCEFAPKRNKKS